MMVAPLDAASIDDSFFDGLDAAAPAFSTGAGAVAASPPPKRAPPPAAEEESDDEVEGMLPLLEDPDDT